MSLPICDRRLAQVPPFIAPLYRLLLFCRSPGPPFVSDYRYTM